MEKRRNHARRFPSVMFLHEKRRHHGRAGSGNGSYFAPQRSRRISLPVSSGWNSASKRGFIIRSDKNRRDRILFETVHGVRMFAGMGLGFNYFYGFTGMTKGMIRRECCPYSSISRGIVPFLRKPRFFLHGIWGRQLVSAVWRRKPSFISASSRG